MPPVYKNILFTNVPRVTKARLVDLVMYYSLQL